ncbi:MAG: hypothetical protein U1F54_13775 [Burkholderiales bacterium]
MRIAPLAHLRAPLGGQEIELQDVEHEGGGMHLLRVRIREGTRFTIIDVDPATIREWAAVMTRWAEAQEGARQ